MLNYQRVHLQDSVRTLIMAMSILTQIPWDNAKMAGDFIVSPNMLFYSVFAVDSSPYT
jgi:hypothetical protein